MMNNLVGDSKGNSTPLKSNSVIENFNIKYNKIECMNLSRTNLERER